MIRTIEEGKRFEQEMTIAHETQKSLLPKANPEFRASQTLVKQVADGGEPIFMTRV